MGEHEFIIYLPRLAWLAFVFAFGGCVGSLINVLAYRLPRGLGVVTPSSRCPACQTKLAWKDNIPIVGWALLRGRCRYCKASISPEYPLVELGVALLFTLFYVLWYMVPPDRLGSPGLMVLGLDLGAIRPEWTLADRYNGVPTATAAPFIVVLLLLGSLAAMTLTDLKTTMIPLALPWFAAAAGVVIHTGYAGWLSLRGEELAATAQGARWTIPTGGWAGAGLGIGGVVGVGVSLALQRLGILARSFADADAWEAEHRREHGLPPLDDGPAADADQPGTQSGAQSGAHADTGQWRPGAGWYRRPVVVGGVTLACGAAGAVLAGLVGWIPGVGLLAGLVAGPVVAAAPLRRLVPPPPPQGESDAADGPGTPSDAEVWIAYPHARREMVREMAFLAAPAALAWAGLWLATQAQGVVPLWLDVLGGTLVGYLVGGGVVWAIRLFGTLGFGKEAMGLGDVHLMAGVGACLGWIDATLAFFAAAFVGIVLTIYTLALSRSVARAMPYGPSLAIATVLVLLAKPAIEQGLTLMTGQRIDLP